MENIIIPKPYKLLDIRPVTDLETLYRVEYKHEENLNFGQFMQLSIPKVGECPISVTEFSAEQGWIEFLIRKVGVVTDELFNLRVGDQLPIRGPYGNGFNMADYAGQKLVIVGGGSGVAPVRSLINHIYNNPNEVKSLNLLFGFKDQESIVFKDDIARWREKFPMILTVDQGCGIDGECVGLVTKYVPQLTISTSDFSDIRVVIVGPPMMMKFTALEFLKLGIAEANMWLSFERKMSCAIGKCGHCRIDETYVCLEGPVFNYVQAKNLID